MDSFIKADIFFFISGIAVILVTLGFIVILCYLVPIIRNIGHISELARKQSDRISGDIDEFRDTVKQEGMKIRNIFDFVISFVTPKKKSNRKKIESDLK